MKRKRESRYPRRIPNKNNKKTEIKRKSEGRNRGLKDETEEKSQRPSRFEFFSFFSCFYLIMGIYWMAITILFIVLLQII